MEEVQKLEAGSLKSLEVEMSVSRQVRAQGTEKRRGGPLEL